MKVQGRWLETALLGSKFWNKPLFLDSSYQPSIYYLILPYVPTWNFFLQEPEYTEHRRKE